MKSNQCKFEEMRDVYHFQMKTAIDSRGSTTKIPLEDLRAMNVNFKADSYLVANNNLSFTTRGIHIQKAPFLEEKIVWCSSGEVYDVVVDFRKDSPTYGKWASVTLSSKSPSYIYLPVGIGHAYQTLVSATEVSYLISGVYSQEHSLTVHLDDNSLGVQFPFPISNLSKKDLDGVPFKQASLVWNS